VRASAPQMWHPREGARAEMCPGPPPHRSFSNTSSYLRTHAHSSTMACTSRRRGGFFQSTLLPVLLTQLCLVNAQVAEIEKASNESLLWGPYRPNLYFGVRPRIAKSLMGGLMWTRVEDHTVQHSKSGLGQLVYHSVMCASM
jgi:hypothetical protein